MPRTLAELKSLVGEEIGVSGWKRVDQALIDRFADCTDDHQWIHVDPERAERESPFGATIAHGFLTLSLLPALAYEIGSIPADIAAGVNYGLDRVRFLTPVRAGAHVRLRVKLLSIEDKGEGRLMLRSVNTLEIEGEERPALVAETLSLLII